MDIFDATTLHLLIIANAALLAATGIAVVRFQNRFRRFEEFWNSPTGAALANSSPDDNQPRPAADPRLERRVAKLQSVVTTLAKKERRVPAAVDCNLPIENAVRMARHGASIDELVRSCGLNIGEAQLLRKLHRKSLAAKKTG